MMDKKKKIFWSVLAAAITAFLVAKGERVTQAIAAIVSALGALDASTFGIYSGVILGTFAHLVAWFYKHKNHLLLKQIAENEKAQKLETLLKEDDTE